MNTNYFKFLPEQLTVNDVAELLNVSSVTVYRWIRKGKISCFQTTNRGTIRISKKDFMEFHLKYYHTIQ